MAKVSLSSGIKYIVFLALGIVIFYFVYKDQDPGEIWAGVKEFKIEWILLSFVFSVLSHIIRALRWRMMILPLGYSPSRLNCFLAILVMYLANYAFPRLGEVTRCGVLTRYEKVPFAPQIGTVVTERVIDLILLILLFIIVIAAQFGLITGFIESSKLKLGFESSWINSGIFWIILATAAISSILVLYLIRASKIAKKFRELLKKFMEGLLSVRKVKNPGLFILYSFGIYAGYFMMTYSVFMGYAPARELGAMGAFLVLAMGSVGMVIPVQGGIGTYHFFVVETALILGLARPEGQLLALVMHGATTIFMIFIGLLALLALPIVNRKTHLIND